MQCNVISMFLLLLLRCTLYGTFPWFLSIVFFSNLVTFSDILVTFRLGPWPMAMAIGDGRWPWPCPLDMAMAMAMAMATLKYHYNITKRHNNVTKCH